MSSDTLDERAYLVNDADDESLRGPRDLSSSSLTSSSTTLYGTFDDEAPKVPLRPTPVPWRSLIVLFMLNSAQPLAFELIFPFVNQMVLAIGVVDDPTKVGYYSGLIESTFALTSFCAIMPLSFISDHYGRKPVILSGILGLSVSVALFGLSKSFMSMLITRSIGGVMGGIWSAMRIMTAELTDKSNQGVAFSGLNAAYRVGQVLAHPMGGWLAHPERRWGMFRTPFWLEFPFSLPCFVSAALGLFAVVLGFFNLRETLHGKHKKKSLHAGDFAAASVVPEPTVPQMSTSPRPPVLEVLSPYVISVLASNMAMAVIGEILFAVYALFAFTPITDGGLGVSEAAIGTHTAIRSALIILFTLAYPAIERRVGLFGLYKVTVFLWPVTVLFFPVLNYMARLGWESTWAFKGTLGLFFIFWAMASISWAAMGIIVNDIAPSAEALSTINSLSGMSIALPQTFAPWIGTSLFAFSIETNIASGGLIWIVMFTWGAVAGIHSLTLRPPHTDWRDKQKSRQSADV